MGQVSNLPLEILNQRQVKNLPHNTSIMNAPRRNRGWIWYFVILGVLTVAAVGVLVTFNVQQQLKPEQVEAARRLWEAKGPPDYDMTYTQKGMPGQFSRTSPKQKTRLGHPRRRGARGEVLPLFRHARAIRIYR